MHSTSSAREPTNRAAPQASVGNDEAAHLLGYSVRTLNRWRTRHPDQLSWQERNGRIRFLPEDLEVWRTFIADRGGSDGDGRFLQDVADDIDRDSARTSARVRRIAADVDTTISRRNYLILKVTAEGHDWPHAIETVTRAAVEHPDWDMDEVRSWSQWATLFAGVTL